MALKFLTAILILFFTCGCATKTLPPVNSNHPASPNAESASRTPKSNTLLIKDPLKDSTMPEMNDSMEGH